MPPPRPPLHVSGSCPKCKAEVKTTAEKGRTTWRGPCPTVGCAGRVIARANPTQPAGAAKGKRPPGKPAEPADPPTTSRGRQRRRIPRVEYDRGTGRPDRDEAAAAGTDPSVRQREDQDRGPAAGDADEHDYRDGPPAGQHTIRAQPVDEQGEPTRRQPRGRTRTRRERSETPHHRSPYPDVYPW
jgi:hypothetical protein